MNELYISVLTALGLNVVNDTIMVDDREWLVNGTKVVLPNTTAAKDLRIVNGKPTLLIFNPIQDNVLKINPITRKLVATYNVKLEIALHTMLTVGYLASVNNTALPPTVAMLTTELLKAKGSAKKLIDDVAISTLKKVIAWSVENDKYILKLYPVNGITVMGEKVTSAITYTSPLLECLDDDESEIHNVLKRRKDRDLLNHALTFILNMFNTDNENVLAYSSAEVGPMFTTLLKGVTRGNAKVNKMLKGLSRIDESICNDAMLPDVFDGDTIANIQNMNIEASKVIRVDGTDNVSKHNPVSNNTTQPESGDDYVPGTTIKRKNSGTGYPQHYNQQPQRQQRDHLQDRYASVEHRVGYGQPHYGQQHYDRQPPFHPDTMEVFMDERTGVFVDYDGYEIDPRLQVLDDGRRYFVELPPQPQQTHYGQGQQGYGVNRQSVQFTRS